MPTPSVPPPPKERALPANLDELVRRAMSGQGVGELKKALAQNGPPPGAAREVATPDVQQVRVAATPNVQEAPVVAAPPPAQFAAPLLPQPVAPPVAQPAKPTVSPGPLPGDPLVSLVAAASRALAANARGDQAELARALDAATTHIEAIRLGLTTRGVDSPPPVPQPSGHPGSILAEASLPTVEPEPVERSVRLPPIRHAFALVLGAPPAGSEVGAIAAALGVDLATARNVAITSGTRITLRGADRAELERRAAAVRPLGIPAVVVAREHLAGAGPAWAVVGFESADQWRLVAADLWLDPPDPQNLPRGEPYALVAPRVTVIGEVEVKRLRADPSDSKWQRSHFAAAKGAGGETRLAVLDLVFPDRLLRVVEGGFDPRGIPGADLGSSRRSLKALQDWLASNFPSLRVEPRRICVAAPVLGVAGREDGWAGWEEHSRACALLGD